MITGQITLNGISDSDLVLIWKAKVKHEAAIQKAPEAKQPGGGHNDANEWQRESEALFAAWQIRNRVNSTDWRHWLGSDAETAFRKLCKRNERADWYYLHRP